MIRTLWHEGKLEGEGVLVSKRTVGDLGPYWADPAAAEASSANPLYETYAYFPAPDGTEGAVLWGSTILHPGKVGGEYHMTRGHFHLKPTHGELIVTVSGQGLLVLMDKEGKTWTEDLAPGTTHAIDGRYAHRTVNTGDEPLIFWCSWPADCGHDYQSILEKGFTQRFFG